MPMTTDDRGVVAGPRAGLASGGWGRTLGMRRRSTRSKLVLPVPAASEFVDLLEDVPGEADEDPLDDAHEALQSTVTTIPADDQQRIGAGELVAVEVSHDDVDAALELIEQDNETDRRALRRLGGRLKGKLKAARRRR